MIKTSVLFSKARTHTRAVELRGWQQTRKGKALTGGHGVGVCKTLILTHQSWVEPVSGACLEPLDAQAVAAALSDLLCFLMLLVHSLRWEHLSDLCSIV